MTGPDDTPPGTGTPTGDGSAVGTGVVVAVDGTSGSGKSSTSRGVADRLGLASLDTGAMYRAVTWWMLRRDVDVQDPAAVAARAGDPQVVSGIDPAAPTITVDGEDVTVAIRTPEVNAAVSWVSAVPAVRRSLLTLQRSIIETQTAADGGGRGIVVEGRDIGSVVWPEATVKIYLSADPDARATRRAAEEGGTDVTATRDSLAARDRIDSGRSVSPLTQVEGAVAVDTTAHTLDEVIERVLDLVHAARPALPGARAASEARA